MNDNTWRRNTFLVSALFLIVVAVLLSESSLFRLFDASLQGMTYRFGFTENSERNIVIVTIDEESFARLKMEPELREFSEIVWPWPPRLHALLLKRLADNGVSAVAFDILFSESFGGVYLPEYASPDALIRESDAAGIPIVMAAMRDAQHITLPLPVYRQAGFKTGLVNIPRRAWSGVDRYQFLQNASESLALALVKAANGEKALQFLGWSGERLAETRLLDFRNEYHRMFPIISYSDVLLQRVPQNVQQQWRVKNPKELFDGAMVLIGRTTLDAQDIHPTPIGSIPGVALHAAAASMLLRSPETAPKAPGLILVVGLLLSGISAGKMAAGAQSLLRSIFFAIVFLVMHALLSVWLFREYHLLVSYAGFWFCFFGSWIAGSVINAGHARQEKHFLQGVFGKYVSPNVATTLLANPDMIRLGGTSEIITILFSDIAGFTSMSETMQPETLIDMLNRYFRLMSNEVLTRDGTLDKYIGDAIMAFWGAPISQPDHAVRACEALLGMKARLAEFNASIRDILPAGVRFRVGINTGRCVVGNAGSEWRFDYTAIGDPVNTASRLEGLGKKYGVYNIVGEDTVKLVDKQFDFRLLDRVTVVGKKETTGIYELMGHAGKTPAMFLQHHREAMDAYFNRDWKNARTLFSDLAREYADEHSKIMLQRLDKLESDPDLAARFNGVWAFTSK